MLERGEGPYVFDTDGKRYIDALSSLFCAQIGYSHGEEMAAAAAEQLTTLAFNTNWGTAHPAALELAERLAAVAPGDLNKVFFTSGGSESVEAAWKLAREFHLANGQPQRTKAIARQTAYHGVTLGALSFTGVPRFKEPFGRAPIDVTHVSNTNAFRDEGDPATFCARLLAEVEAAILAAGPDEVALIIAEPVQNSGGCLMPPAGYWQGLRELADRYGALLMADEVITGCRPARPLVRDRARRRRAGPRVAGQGPDLGLRADGRRRRPRARRAWQGVFRHGITFGGHPLCAAIA